MKVNSLLSMNRRGLLKGAVKPQLEISEEYYYVMVLVEQSKKGNTEAVRYN